MELTNDEKAIDETYKSPISFLGKNKKLGRTNKRIVIELKRLYRKEDSLIKIEDNKEFEEEYSKWESDLNKILKQIISPWKESEIKDLEMEDIEDILKEINRRQQRRRGLTDDEIKEIEDADHKVLIANARNINEGNLDFLNPNTE